MANTDGQNLSSTLCPKHTHTTRKHFFMCIVLWAIFNNLLFANLLAPFKADYLKQFTSGHLKSKKLTIGLVFKFRSKNV